MIILFKPNVGKLERAGDVGGLIKALKHQDITVRTEAAHALGRIGDARAIEPLLLALKENRFGNKASVRGPVAHALCQIQKLPEGAEKAYHEVSTPFSIRWKEIVKIGEAALQPIIQYYLKHEASPERTATVDALSLIGKPAIEPLIRILGDEKSSVRAREIAARALGKIEAKEAVEPLIQALKDENGHIREDAAIALGNIGDGKAVEPLAQLLSSEATPLRKSAAYSLGGIGDARAVKPLADALNDGNWEVREASAVALGWHARRFEDKESMEQLFQLLSFPDIDGHAFNTRHYAARALEDIWNKGLNVEDKSAVRVGDWHEALFSLSREVGVELRSSGYVLSAAQRSKPWEAGRYPPLYRLCPKCNKEDIKKALIANRDLWLEFSGTCPQCRTPTCNIWKLAPETKPRPAISCHLPGYQWIIKKAEEKYG